MAFVSLEAEKERKCVYSCVYVCMCVRVCVCVCVCAYICVCISIFMCASSFVEADHMYACTYIHMHICLFIILYDYIMYMILHLYI